MNFNFRACSETNHFIIGEIRLDNRTLFDRDFAMQSGRQAEHDGALDLGLQTVGIHRHAAIDSRDDAMDGDRTVGRNVNFGDMGDNRLEGLEQGDTASAPRSNAIR